MPHGHGLTLQSLRREVHRGTSSVVSDIVSPSRPPNDRNDELTTALGEKADAPDTKARESRSFMVIICVLLTRGCARLMRKAKYVRVPPY